MRTFTALGCVLALSAGCHRGAPVASADRGDLTLEVTPTLSGSRRAVLRPGDEVVSGDGIQVAVKPAIDAHVYVAYCDRDRRLTIFPRDGGVAAPAGAITYIPSEEGHIILDDQVGPEVLYVIASRRPLDVADPDLAAALARARPDTAAECGEPFDRVIHGDTQRLTDTGSSEPERPAEPSAPLAAPPAAAAPSSRPAAPPVAPPRLAETPPPGAAPSQRAGSRLPPPVTLERGAFIRWGASGNVSAGGDRNDIVVLRYGFTHVARHAP